MHTRRTTLEIEPDRVDEVIADLEERDIPELRALDGFRGFLALVDRRKGKIVGMSFWQTDDQMRASEEAGSAARERAARTGGAESEPEVEHFEVALDVFMQRSKR